MSLPIPRRPLPLYLTCVLLCPFALPLLAGPAAPKDTPDHPDILFTDFESPTYGDWSTTGTAFGDGPAEGTLPNQMNVTGYHGKRLASSYHGGDNTTGTLTSPPFKVERKYISFLIGGGGYEGKTCVNLLVDDKVVRTATGPNTQPGGSEELAPDFWDVTEFAGREARIQAVDQATGGWGHISLDYVVFTDRQPPRRAKVLSDVSRDVVAEHHWLWFPIKSKATHRMVRVLLDGRVERYFQAELADRPDDQGVWWSPLDVSAWQGKKLTLRVDHLPEDSAALTSLRQSDDWEKADELYKEPLRPQFHFSARRGWLNDPNGLVWRDGEYHLFFQHSPFSWTDATKTWGHAVSRDLVHWRELDDEALWPDERGAMWSGSAVVDVHNTSGFGSPDQGGKPGKPPMVLMYTAAGNPFTQCIAWGTDGRKFAKYADNPVLHHIVGGDRDPKVIWYEPQKKWVMALYLDKDVYALFSSPDLKKWEKLSEIPFPGTNECPEFFPIALDGNKDAKDAKGANDERNTRWVFYGGNGRYLVGSFDGKTFTAQSPPQPLHHGNCWYASQTYNSIPDSDGRRILIPWGTIDIPGMPFNQMMGVPVELTLHATDAGPRLFVRPVRELASLHGKSHAVDPQPLKPGDDPLANVAGVKDVTGDGFDLTAELAPGDAGEIGFTVRGVPVTYDVNKQELVCLGKRAGLKIIDGRIRLRLLVDRTSIDLFGNDGQLYMPMGVIFGRADRPLDVWARGGASRILSLQVHEMKSAWASDGGKSK